MATTIIDPITKVDIAAAPGSAVSWGAIVAGGAAAAALSLVLLILGTGLGLAAVSPWDFEASSAAALGVTTILWLTLTQLLASGLGGYLAGRLRTKWADIAGDEIYFRDTAHGFLAWCVASLASAAVLTSAVGAIVSGGVQAGAAVAGGAVATATSAAASSGAETGGEDPTAYFVDSLFRPRDDAPPAEGSAAATAEVGRIFANALRTGSLGEDDATYVGRVIADRTDLSPGEAEQRVRETFAELQAALQEAEDAAKAAADEARRATAYASLWLVVSLLAGAFVASMMATFGGRQRDL